MIRISIIAAFLLNLIACGHIQKPIAMDAGQLHKNNRIGVAVAQSGNGVFHKTGSIGLLDHAIIAGATGDLSDHVEALTADDFSRVKRNFVALLQKKGVKAVEINEPLNFESFPEKENKDGFAVRDFSELRNKYRIDSLIVLRLSNFGIKRNYYGFIPTSEPNSFAHVEGQLIDLNSHQLKWYYSETLENAITPPWDEPETRFPNVTEGIYNILEKTGYALEDNFIKG